MKLLVGAQQTGRGVTTEGLLRRITEATSLAFGATVRAVGVAGQLPAIPDDTLAPCMQWTGALQSDPPWRLAPEHGASCPDVP